MRCGPYVSGRILFFSLIMLVLTTIVVFFITNALGVKLVRLGWSMKNSLVTLVQLSVVNTDLIP